MNKALEQAMIHARHARRLIEEAKAPKPKPSPPVKQDNKEYKLRPRMPYVGEGLKMCSCCHKIKPAEEFHFVYKNTKYRKGACKECFNAVARVKQRERRKIYKLKQLTSK